MILINNLYNEIHTTDQSHLFIEKNRHVKEISCFLIMLKINNGVTIAKSDLHCR